MEILYEIIQISIDGVCIGLKVDVSHRMLIDFAYRYCGPGLSVLSVWGLG